jgi:MarR family transcriptional regulator, lower aerobic nicotinate degradation pathway regulator
VHVANPETRPARLPRLPRELVDSPVFLLKKLGFRAKEKAFEAYEELGITPYQHAVLAVLDEGSRETQGAIADALGYDRGQLVGILDELEERGFVERNRDPGDRRRHIVRMTPAGRKHLGKLRALATKLDEQFLEPLDERQREQLHALLLTLAEAHLPLCARKAD